MRHQKSGRKLGRNSAHRKAMWRNMVTSLIEHERIQTTEAKAKELRRFAERTITIALRQGDLLDKPVADMSRDERVKRHHAMKQASRMIRTQDVLEKLFEDVAPRLKGRPGGYTRIMKIGRRPGDAAPMVFIELVCREDGAEAAAAEA